MEFSLNLHNFRKKHGCPPGDLPPLMKSARSMVLFLFVCVSGTCPQQADAQARGPLTVAESSDFRSTSRYSDVLDFVRKLQELSPLIRVERLCTSTEGRDVPLLVIGKPLPASPQELRHDPRLVVYLQANIHAGEVEGKDAVLMLARDILLPTSSPYLDQVILIIAPIYNADGNDKISPDNRRSQVGPVNGVGVRQNGQNLDINRDAMKAETPEVRGLIDNVLLRWDPELMVDCHTTNGSYHDEPVTYSWVLNPNGPAQILEYMRDEMMPAVAKTLKGKYGMASLPYGEYVDPRKPEKGWETFGHETRYITNYIGLRNRLAVLDENYSYADFKTRVEGCYNLLRSVLDFAAANTQEIQHLVREADRQTILRGSAPAARDSFAVEFELRPLSDPVTIQGYELEAVKDSLGHERLQKTERKKVYTVPCLSDYTARRNVRYPFGYAVDAADPTIIAALTRHGVLVERLTTSATLDVQSFRITELTAASRPYQGHYMNRVKGEYVDERRTFPPGTIFVPTAQPLGVLAATLLEPESDDGLLVWNVMDRYLVPQWSKGFGPYPVYRVLTPCRLAKETVR
jgi:Zinc carboxypeptidase